MVVYYVSAILTILYIGLTRYFIKIHHVLKSGTDL
jgi:hypothetical protein